MLEIDALTFRYAPDATAYRFDFTLAPGSVLGLTGPSGSGKSTLLDLLAGFRAPETGSIALDARPLHALPPERRPASILFQADNLFAHLSVTRNVALGVPRAKATPERISNALDQMGLNDTQSRRAGTLSGGQKQRVALARTLLRDQPVLLLDEPFSGIDAEAVAPIRALIMQLVRQRGWHAIIVSHNPDDIDAMADTHFAMQEGRAVPSG